MSFAQSNNYKTDRACSTQTVRNSSSLTVIVNKLRPNLDKTTSSVLSVILINLWLDENETKMCSVQCTRTGPLHFNFKLLGNLFAYNNIKLTSD